VAVVTSERPPLDLSKATKLKKLSFRCGDPDVQRITMTLETVQSKDLRQIAIHSYGTFATLIGETARQAWRNLDRLLVQFWTSHSIRPNIVHEMGKGGRDLASSLLPELTRSGVVDLVEG
jgi:hypothetical protein